MPAVEQSPSVGFEQLLLAVCLTSGAFLLPPYGPPYPHSGRRREEDGGEEERGGGRGAWEGEGEGGRQKVQFFITLPLYCNIYTRGPAPLVVAC